MLELEEILNGYHPDYETTIQVLDTGFTVKTNSEELARKLARYFSGWRSNSEKKTSYLIHAVVGEGILDRHKLVDVVRRPGKQVKEAYYDSEDGRIVLKKRTGVVIYLKGSECFIVGDLIKNFNQIVNQINEVYLQDYLRKGYLLLHASAVVNSEGQGSIFCSDSGIGKSTVAVALLQHGFKFLSNDRVLLKVADAGVELVGVPKKPRVNPGTILAVPALENMLSARELKRYSSMDKEELWHLESKHDVEVGEIFGQGKMVLRAALGAIYLLDWRRTSSTLRVIEIDPDADIALLRSNVLNLNPKFKDAGDPERIDAHLSKLIRLVKLYSIQGGVDVRGLCSYMEQK